MKKMVNSWLFLAILANLPLFSGNPIHVIWLGLPIPEQSWEKDWIYEILSDVTDEIDWIVDVDYSVVLDRSIIITSQPNSCKYKEYYNKYAENGYKWGVIHLSDEGYTHPTDFYKKASFVFRNYWNSDFDSSKVIYFPLGYKQGFWIDGKKENKLATERAFTWSFAGQIVKSTRLSMIEHLKTISENYIYEIGSFNAPDSLSVVDYRDLLLESIFIPCPRGFCNLDTFRLVEALECGCIPIVEKSPFDYFSQCFGSYPFLAINSWNEAPKLISYYLLHPDKLEEKRIECYNWWIEYKKNLKQIIASYVESNFS